MEKKTINDVSQDIRELYSRAIKTRGDQETMLRLLCDIVKQEPTFMQAREKLRDAERRKTMELGGFGKAMASFGAVFKLGKVRKAMSDDPVQAMALCEELLLGNLANPAVLKLLAEAADEADAPYISVEAMNLLRVIQPKNETVMRELARYMQHNGQAAEAVRVIQEIAANHPGDIKIQSEVRAAMAVASLEKSKREAVEAADANPNLAAVEKASANDSLLQQLLADAIRDPEKAKIVIEKLGAPEIEANASVDVRKKLYESYKMIEDYDNAIDQLQKVAASIGAMDPAIDKLIEGCVIARFDQAIAELRKNPAAYDEPERQIAGFEAEREEYRLKHARARVKSYPTDATLNFELAELLFDKGLPGEALPFYQTARRNPQFRLQSSIRIARCFAADGRNDMAIEQFEAVLAEMPRMDKQKMELSYFLANTLEKAGQMEKAMTLYKEIYQEQSNYLDVEERIRNFYDKPKAD